MRQRKGFAPPDALRIPFVRRCTIQFPPQQFQAMSLDISLKGMFIATPELPDIATDLTIAFKVPSNIRTLEIPARVAWLQTKQTHPIHGLPLGFGLFFTKLALEDVRLIARTIQSYCQSNPLYRQYL